MTKKTLNLCDISLVEINGRSINHKQRQKAFCLNALTEWHKEKNNNWTIFTCIMHIIYEVWRHPITCTADLRVEFASLHFFLQLFVLFLVVVAQASRTKDPGPGFQAVKGHLYLHVNTNCWNTTESQLQIVDRDRKARERPQKLRQVNQCSLPYKCSLFNSILCTLTYSFTVILLANNTTFTQ